MNDPGFPKRPSSRENLEMKLTLAEIDRSCRAPVLLFVIGGVAWLLIGSLLALVAAIKMHHPEFLAGASWLTFGRVRPAHLNAMTYGWAAQIGIGVILWLQARLSKVRLILPRVLMGVGLAWNLVVGLGVIAILAGFGTSVEWLEFPFPIALALGVLFGVFGLVSFMTFVGRRSEHIYISQWYIFAAILWFPYLYLVANLMIHLSGARGAVQGSANWWFAHNVLGLWLTPIGLAAIYYLIPKVIGRPIYSYYLSILGFWTLAMFYNWAGTHHLIGGPLPAWLITVGIVGSVMMFIPVITVGINHHMTMIGSFHVLKTSPTLRFVVFAGFSYTITSFQGSLQSLRSVNEIEHFTHYTIAHAHLGVVAFYTMAMFGAIYYMLPRLTGIEWASARLIRVHFWSTAGGNLVYYIPLTVGGWFQGLKMNNPDVPFLDIVNFTKPFLGVRSLSGVMLTFGHLALALLIARMLRELWSRRGAPARRAPDFDLNGPEGGLEVRL